MLHNQPTEFLGVDYGDARVGLARGSDVARLAEPLRAVPTKDVLNAIKNWSAGTNSAGVVVGLPRGLDGQETSQTRAVREWVKSVKDHLSLPFYWQDEALTSLTASKLKAKNEQVSEDALAASIILQDFLDTPSGERRRA